MPSFSTDIHEVEGRLRPIVGVFIGPEPLSEPSPTAVGQIQNTVDMVYARGLIDTGATNTSITKALAAKIQAVPLKQVPVHSATHHAVATNVYKVTLIIGVTQDDQKPAGQAKPVLYSKPMVQEVIEFVGADDIVPDIDILIGMDIISQSVLVIAGHDKRITMSF